jgi:hypothetical protein
LDLQRPKQEKTQRKKCRTFFHVLEIQEDSVVVPILGGAIETSVSLLLLIGGGGAPRTSRLDKEEGGGIFESVSGLLDTFGGIMNKKNCLKIESLTNERLSFHHHGF